MTATTRSDARPAYGRPAVWAAGKLSHVTLGPSGPSGENHNRNHPAAQPAQTPRR